MGHLGDKIILQNLNWQNENNYSILVGGKTQKGLPRPASRVAPHTDVFDWWNHFECGTKTMINNFFHFSQHIFSTRHSVILLHRKIALNLCGWILLIERRTFSFNLALNISLYRQSNFCLPAFTIFTLDKTHIHYKKVYRSSIIILVISNLFTLSLSCCSGSAEMRNKIYVQWSHVSWAISQSQVGNIHAHHVFIFTQSQPTINWKESRCSMISFWFIWFPLQ